MSKNQDYNNRINDLVLILEKYVNMANDSLRTPAMEKYLEELISKKNYYYAAMKGLIPILELKEEDKRELPQDKISEWESLRFVAAISEAYDSDLGVSKDQLRTLRSIYHDLHSDVEEEIEILKGKIAQIDETESVNQIKCVNSTINKIKNDLDINNSDYEIIKLVINELAVNDKITNTDEYNAYALLTEYLIKDHNLVNIDKIVSDDEIIETVVENEEFLIDEDLTNLFKKYGYDYNLVENKDTLRKYGNLDKMDNIFAAISKYKVYSDNLFKNLALVLAYSDIDIVKSILNNMDKDTLNNLGSVDGNDLFNAYLSNPYLFIRGTKCQVNKKGGKGPKSSGDIHGDYNNYLLNREFFIKHGVNINDKIKECSTVFGIKNQTLEDTYFKFKTYDISDEKIFSRISCLKVKDVYSNMDLMLELGLKVHLLNYLAQSVHFVRENFERILICRKMGEPVISNEAKQRFLSKITTTSDKTVLKVAHITEEEVSSFLGVKEFFTGEEGLEFKALCDSITANAFYDKYDKIQDSPFISYLDDNFLADDNLYIIDDAVISRRKVVRLYSALAKNITGEGNANLLMYALTSGSILTADQLESIKKAVSHAIMRGARPNEGTN